VFFLFFSSQIDSNQWNFVRNGDEFRDWKSEKSSKIVALSQFVPKLTGVTIPR